VSSGENMDYLEKAKKLITKMKDQAEPINSDREHRLVAYSKLTGRDIVVSWTGDNPKVVHVDQTSYTLSEIAKLQGMGSDRVRQVHHAKEIFDGEETGK
jgi:hypothetical protein